MITSLGDSVTAFRFKQSPENVTLSRNDRKYFPIWVERYQEAAGSVNGILRVSEASVIAFLRELLSGGVPAWQRLQAVRAIVCYQKLLLRPAERVDLGYVSRA